MVIRTDSTPAYRYVRVIERAIERRTMLAQNEHMKKAIGEFTALVEGGSSKPVAWP